MVTMGYVSLTVLFTLIWCLVRYIASSWKQHRRKVTSGAGDIFIASNALPFGIDWICNMIAARKEQRLPQEIQRQFSVVGGRTTYAQSLFGVCGINTCDPENVQALLATQFRDFELGPYRRAAFDPLLGTGIFTADGTTWEHSRALLRPQFTREQISNLEAEENHVQDLNDLLRVDADRWTSVVDLAPALFRLTIDSATELLFGQSIESQKAAVQEQSNDGDPSAYQWKDIACCLDAATDDLGYRIQLGPFSWLHTSSGFRQNCQKVHQFADHFVQEAMKRQKSTPSPNQERYVFLHELIKVLDDPVQIRNQLLNILLAGRDTTAGLLCWTIWCLSRRPDTFQSLRNTILDQFGTFEAPKNLNFNALKSCQYLQFVLHETLRLYPPVPINVRQATRDTTLPVGGGTDGKSPILVAKHQPVYYYVQMMHRRKDLWGDDADEFRPERWIKHRPGWSYLPFNGGPRICLGQQSALTEASYVIVRLLQRFDILEPAGHDLVPLHKFSVTSSPAQVLVRLHAQ